MNIDLPLLDQIIHILDDIINEIYNTRNHAQSILESTNNIS